MESFDFRNLIINHLNFIDGICPLIFLLFILCNGVLRVGLTKGCIEKERE